MIHLQEKKYKVFSYMMDGVMLYINKDWEKDLENLNTFIQNKYNDTTIVFTQKTILNEAKIIEDEVDTEMIDKMMNEKKDYESVKKRMEDKYKLCKILTGEYMVNINDEWKCYTKEGITNFLNDTLYWEVDKEKNKKELKPLYKNWIPDENKLSYNKIVCEPNSTSENELNIYQPYDIYKHSINDYNHDEEGLNMFKHLISIVCNHQENTISVFTKWIAHLIQHEGEKAGISFVFTGKQGTGKDTIIETIVKILGHKKVFSTTQPETHVWGKFNSLIKDAKLVHISEVDKSNTYSHMNKIKGLLTDPQITIKAECEKPFTISSYHNYIVATNDDCPIDLKADQRRFIVVRTSTDLKGKEEWFSKYYGKLQCIDFLMTLFHYLKNIEDVPKRFTEKHIKEGASELHNSIVSGNTDIETEFLKSFIETYYDPDDISYSIATSELFRLFNEYRKENNCDKYDYSQKKFTLKMNVYNLEDFKDCIQWKRTKKGCIFVIDTRSLNDKFSQGYLMEDDE